MTSRTVATNGIRMHVVEEGSGPPLIFLHGLGWDHELWKSAMSRFADRYRVIAADTRGHGRSDKPKGPYSIATFAADWLGLLQALDVRSACFVGFSQGGMIAQLLAVEHPKLVDALVLVSTSCRSDPSVRDKLEERIKLMREAGAAAAARLAARSIFSSGYERANPGAIEDFVRWRAQMDQEALVSATRAGNGFDVSERLAAVTVPSIVISGEEDLLTPPPVVKAVAKALGGTELHSLPGAGHMIPVEQPEVFEGILSSFLERQYDLKKRGDTR